MPIKIIPCGSAFTKTIEGVEFMLYRLSAQEDLELKREHTTRGIIDNASYTQGLLEKGVRGWGPGIRTQDDQPFEYAPDRTWSLPDTVRAQILNAVMEGRPTNEPESNSPAGSDGG